MWVWGLGSARGERGLKAGRVGPVWDASRVGAGAGGGQGQGKGRAGAYQRQVPTISALLAWGNRPAASLPAASPWTVCDEGRRGMPHPECPGVVPRRCFQYQHHHHHQQQQWHFLHYHHRRRQCCHPNQNQDRCHQQQLTWHRQNHCWLTLPQVVVGREGLLSL